MFTSNRDQKYSSINFNQIKLMSSKYQIYFENEAAEKIFNNLLMHPCRICKNNPPDHHPDPAAFQRSIEFKSLKDLDAHLRREHELFLCDLCVENLKVFSNERKYYTRKDLVRHKRTGDPEDTSHRGHPLCKFCDVRFMDDEDLHRHLRKDHYYCHFCDPLGLNQFYDSYHNLRDHYSREHFLCEEGTCREERFTSVFRSEIDLQAHRASSHCNTRMEAKEARILSIDFSLKPRSSGLPGSVPQISAAIHHQSGFQHPYQQSQLQQQQQYRRPNAPAGLARGAIGGTGGAEYEYEHEAFPAAPQELPKPEDFPSLALGSDANADAVTTDAARIGSKKDAVSSGSGAGKGAAAAAASGSYGDLAEKFKDSSQKVSGKVAKSRKGFQEGPSFSSRIGGGAGAVMARTDDDFPALSCASLPCPVGSSISSYQKRELRNAYATLSSVAAAVTSSVPKVVSKVATATCLPSSSSNSASLMTSCTPGGGSKSLSTQSLISSAPSLSSAQEFPSLPFTESAAAAAAANRKQQTGKQSKKRNQQQQQQLNTNSINRPVAGIRNPGFAGSSESFAALTKGTKLTAGTSSSSGAAGGKAAEASKKNQPAGKSDKVKGSAQNSMPSLSSFEAGADVTASGTMGISRLKSSLGSTGGSGGPTKSELEQISKSLLKNEQEFPGLDPASGSGSSGNVPGNKAGNKKTGKQKKQQQSGPESASHASTDRIVVSSNIIRKVNPGSGSGVAMMAEKLNQQQLQQHQHQQQQRKGAPPPPPHLSDSGNSFASGSSSKNKKRETGEGQHRQEDLSLSSVAQVILTGGKKNKKPHQQQEGEESAGGADKGGNGEEGGGRKGKRKDEEAGATHIGSTGGSLQSNSSAPASVATSSSIKSGKKKSPETIMMMTTTATSPPSHCVATAAGNPLLDEGRNHAAAPAVSVRGSQSGSDVGCSRTRNIGSEGRRREGEDENGNPNGEDVGSERRSASSYPSSTSMTTKSILQQNVKFSPSSPSPSSSSAAPFPSNSAGRDSKEVRQGSDRSVTGSRGTGGSGSGAAGSLIGINNMNYNGDSGNNANHVLTSDQNSSDSGSKVSAAASHTESFLPPVNFEQRNLSLVSEVSDILRDHAKFSAFKRISNEFRRGETKADEYYKKCIELFGRTNFNKIFGQLITLLPNVRKQNELLSAHEKSLKVNKGAVTSSRNQNRQNSSAPGVWIINETRTTYDQGILVCPVCQQVLAIRDGAEHMSCHSNAYS